MNKKADVEISKVILLILAILALILAFVFVKGTLNDLVNSFITFIKQIFKY
ncbi:hypothetical protein HYX16_04550 [Candidatus Woesearchaeota archaeon]|nr:hypothetical protein [Candidatus Woesearchaeota archaeon]